MANMSYCRFRNTLVDFGECLDIVEKAQDLNVEISPEELTAAKHLYKLAERYVELFPEVVYNDY